MGETERERERKREGRQCTSAEKKMSLQTVDEWYESVICELRNW